jgi:hypothetical protein
MLGTSLMEGEALGTWSDGKWMGMADLEFASQKFTALRNKVRESRRVSFTVCVHSPIFPAA